MIRILIFALGFLATLSPAAARAQDGIFDRLATGGKGGWLNVTRPLTADDMKGRLVLLDFWTYGCVNCMLVIPDLAALEEKFGDRLLIIGVHSAKFEGERDNGRILAAAKRFGLKHPVINDSDYAIWKAFGVGAWPTQILLGPDGRELARYSGEGHLEEIAYKIRSALGKVTATSSLDGLIDTATHEKALRSPARIAYAAQSPWGPVFIVADSGHHRIAVFGPDAALKTTIGNGTAGFADGSLTTARFNQPRGIALAGQILYVADTGNNRIRRIDLRSGDVTTIAGTGARGSRRLEPHFPALQAPLAAPWDVDVLTDGKTLAIANAGTHQIIGYDITSRTVSLLAGSGIEDIADGPALSAALAQPSGLAHAGSALFFADAESSSLRVLDNGTVKTLVGTGLFDFGLRDGAYPQAMLQHPQGLYADTARVIIADTYNKALRIYDRGTGLLATLTLTGVPINEPGDVLVLGDTAYVVDTGGHAVYKVDLSTGRTTPWL